MGREAFDQVRAEDDPPAPSDADLVARIVQLLAQVVPEISEASPGRLAIIEAMVRREFAGEKVWIRKRAPLDRARVLARFNGTNATEVARELGISRATVYRLLKQPGRPRR